MSTDLFTILDLPNKYSSYRLLSVTSDDLNNASFVFHSLIQSRLRASAPLKDIHNPLVVLILTNQAYSHYSTVAAKSFGLNLKSHKDEGRLKCFDLLTDYEKYFEDNVFNFKLLVDEVVRFIVDNIVSQTDLTPCVMFDDLSTFLALGVSVADLHKFTLVLRSLSYSKQFCLIIQSTYEEDSEDDELRHMVTLLSARSDIWLHLEKLKTGYSQQIDGTLTIRNIKKLNGDSVNRKFHYKTFDRNTKLYHPGAITTL